LIKLAAAADAQFEMERVVQSAEDKISGLALEFKMTGETVAASAELKAA